MKNSVKMQKRKLTTKRNQKAQLDMLAREPLAYGGKLLNTRKGRSSGRTLDTKNTMHMVLKSSLAKGKWSFNRPENKKNIKDIFRRFTTRYAVRIYSIAYVGNHLHFQMKLSNRHTYKPFIRGLTAAIAMAVTRASRWNPTLKDLQFWDYRPFSRVILGFRNFLNLRDYIRINQFEGLGFHREEARFILSWNQLRKNTS